LKHGFEDGDPRFLDSDYYTPDRILFLDGTIQSLYSADATYHEALVHPVMFVHPSPARVAIIGGGEGATLREVLKHNTLKHVTMIEIDEELIEIVREYLPQMSDCSDLVGRADNCFDDELVDVVVENGAKWFIDRYGSSPPVESAPADPFDVLIVDALDPEDTSTFWKDLYGDSIFVSSLMKSLSEEGVLMIRIGQTPDLSDPRPDLGPYKVREKLLQMFEEHPDVAAMHVYEEMRSGFLDPHSFLVVCRNVSCRSRWYAKSDVIDYNIYDRIVKTKSGREALKFFDGTTQYSYQVPPMHWEAVYCRREPTPFECAYRSLDFSKPIHEFYLDNDERSSFRIEMKSNDEGKLIGSSVFAKVHIPKGSFIMPDHLARSVVLSEESIESIQSNVNMGAPVYQALTNFIEWNAHKTHIEGTEVRHLEVGATILIREVASEEEANVGRWVPPHPTGKCPPFSPVYDRHRFSFNTFMVATRDIPAGDELTRFEKMWQ
jgi:spermidine synthase